MSQQIKGITFIGEFKARTVYPSAFNPERDLQGGEISVPISFLESVRSYGRDALRDSGSLLGKPEFTYIIRNPSNGKYFFGMAADYNRSVEEFRKEIVYVPNWMFQSFGITEGDQLEFCYVKFDEVEKPYIKLRPVTENFYKCKDPCKALEEILNKFSAASLDFPFYGPNPENPSEEIGFVLVETKPFPTVTLLHGETTIDFAPMPGHEDAPADKKKKEEPTIEVDDDDDDDDDDDKSGGSSGNSFLKESGDGAISMDYSAGHLLSDSIKAEDDRTCCPTCGKYIADASFKLHTMRCARLHVKCPACGKFVERTALAAHKAEFHTQVPCPKCGEMVAERGLLGEHAKTCPMEEVPCKYCKEIVARKDAQEHEEYCGSKTVKCEKCGKYITRRKYEEHAASGCKRESAPPAGPRCPICDKEFRCYGPEYSSHVNSCLGDSGSFGGNGNGNWGRDHDHYMRNASDDDIDLDYGTKDKVCPICEMRFSTVEEVQRHFSEAHE